jgi:hypothetical protein
MLLLFFQLTSSSKNLKEGVYYNQYFTINNLDPDGWIFT